MARKQKEIVLEDIVWRADGIIASMRELKKFAKKGDRMLKKKPDSEPGDAAIQDAEGEIVHAEDEIKFLREEWDEYEKAIYDLAD